MQCQRRAALWSTSSAVKRVPARRGSGDREGKGLTVHGTGEFLALDVHRGLVCHRPGETRCRSLSSRFGHCHV